MIHKFPIKGEFGDYHVRIDKEYVTLGMYQLVGHLIKKRESKRFYQKEWMTIFSYETGWDNYNTYIVDLVGLAILTVNEYEDTIRFEKEKEVALLELIDWDGQIN